MKNNFNLVAPLYDFIAKLVFGNKLEHAQRLFLSHIKRGDKVLIVGGGTGRILEWLPEIEALQICYVEQSAAMLKRAKMRTHIKGNVSFVEDDVLNTDGLYDVVISNFLLDCFEEEKLERIINHFKGLLTRDGTLYVTDFCVPSKTRQKLLMKTMHLFFKLTSRLESKKIKDINQHILRNGMKTQKEVVLFEGLIFSRVYQKLPD